MCLSGETDDGDSDTSHPLGASPLAVPSSPYADEDEADPLNGANINVNAAKGDPGMVTITVRLMKTPFQKLVIIFAANKPLLGG